MHWSDKMINVSIILQQLLVFENCMTATKYYLIINVVIDGEYVNRKATVARVQ